MESATSLSLSLPLSSSTFSARPAVLISTASPQQRHPGSKVAAMGGGGYHGGSSVDENMIVLRMRIREMEMSEGGKSAPEDWMEWEKRCYGAYNEEVCKAVGVLQWYLMNVRPSLGLASLVIILSSLPVSTLVLMFHALHMVSAILPAFHPWW